MTFLTYIFHLFNVLSHHYLTSSYHGRDLKIHLGSPRPDSIRLPLKRMNSDFHWIRNDMPLQPHAYPWAPDWWGGIRKRRGEFQNFLPWWIWDSAAYMWRWSGRGGTGGRGAVTNPKEGVGGGAGRKVRVKAALLPCSSSFNSLKIGSNHLRQPGRFG